MTGKKKSTNKREAESQINQAAKVADPQPKPILEVLEEQILAATIRLETLQRLRQNYLDDSVQVVDGTRAILETIIGSSS